MSAASSTDDTARIGSRWLPVLLAAAATAGSTPAHGRPGRDIRYVGDCDVRGQDRVVPLEQAEVRSGVERGAVVVCGTPGVGWRAAARWDGPRDAWLSVVADVERWVEFLPYVVGSTGGGPPETRSVAGFTLQVRGRRADHAVRQWPEDRGLGFRIVGAPASPIREANGRWYWDDAEPGIVFYALDVDPRWWLPGGVLGRAGREGVARFVWEVRRRAGSG